MSTNETKLPAIPPIPSNADPQLKTYLAAVDEALKVRLGRTGDPKDRAVTVRELIDAGIAENFLENPFNPNAGTPDNTFVPTTTIELTIPPDVTGFSGAGAFQKIILSWDLAQFPNFAFTEIWRHTSNSIGDATRIDTTRAQVYADTVDAGANFYYWVRHVSTSNIVGQFTSGINVTTSKISNSNVSDFITTGALTAAQIQAGSLTSASGVFGAISANDITAGTLNATNVSVSNLNIGGVAVAGSIGKIDGTSGQNEADNGQDISTTEIVRSIWGSNNYPRHIAGTASTSSDPQVSVGDVVGDQNGGVNVPIFSFNFTTSNFSGTRDFLIMTGLDFTGSSTSSSEAVFAVAMKATTSSTNFRTTSRSDYLFTEKITSQGSHSLGVHNLNEKVSLTGNTEYYIWAFAVSDDGASSYKSGFINVFGLNK